MKTVYIEKSCGPARDGAWTAELDLAGAERIVVGNPMNMNGTAGPRSEKCRAFAALTDETADPL